MLLYFRYKEGRYPENMESLTISNISQVVAEVQFYFLHDNNASTFLLDPQDMSLQPSESKVCDYVPLVTNICVQ